jgi:hypothetical protein
MSDCSTPTRSDESAIGRGRRADYVGRTGALGGSARVRWPINAPEGLQPTWR